MNQSFKVFSRIGFAFLFTLTASQTADAQSSTDVIRVSPFKVGRALTKSDCRSRSISCWSGQKVAEGEWWISDDFYECFCCPAGTQKYGDTCYSRNPATVSNANYIDRTRTSGAVRDFEIPDDLYVENARGQRQVDPTRLDETIGFDRRGNRITPKDVAGYQASTQAMRAGDAFVEGLGEIDYSPQTTAFENQLLNPLTDKTENFSEADIAALRRITGKDNISYGEIGSTDYYRTESMGKDGDRTVFTGYNLNDPAHRARLQRDLSAHRDSLKDEEMQTAIYNSGETDISVQRYSEQLETRLRAGEELRPNEAERIRATVGDVGFEIQSGQALTAEQAATVREKMQEGLQADLSAVRTAASERAVAHTLTDREMPEAEFNEEGLPTGEFAETIVGDLQGRATPAEERPDGIPVDAIAARGAATPAQRRQARTEGEDVVFGSDAVTPLSEVPAPAAAEGVGSDGTTTAAAASSGGDSEAAAGSAAPGGGETAAADGAGGTGGSGVSPAASGPTGDASPGSDTASVSGATGSGGDAGAATPAADPSGAVDFSVMSATRPSTDAVDPVEGREPAAADPAAPAAAPVAAAPGTPAGTPAEPEEPARTLVQDYFYKDDRHRSLETDHRDAERNLARITEGMSEEELKLAREMTSTNDLAEINARKATVETDFSAVQREIGQDDSLRTQLEDARKAREALATPEGRARELERAQNDLDIAQNQFELLKDEDINPRPNETEVLAVRQRRDEIESQFLAGEIDFNQKSELLAENDRELQSAYDQALYENHVYLKQDEIALAEAKENKFGQYHDSVMKNNLSKIEDSETRDEINNLIAAGDHEGASELFRSGILENESLSDSTRERILSREEETKGDLIAASEQVEQREGELQALIAGEEDPETFLAGLDAQEAAQVEQRRAELDAAQARVDELSQPETPESIAAREAEIARLDQEIADAEGGLLSEEERQAKIAQRDTLQGEVDTIQTQSDELTASAQREADIAAADDEVARTERLEGKSLAIRDEAKEAVDKEFRDNYEEAGAEAARENNGLNEHYKRKEANSKDKCKNSAFIAEGMGDGKTDWNCTGTDDDIESAQLYDLMLGAVGEIGTTTTGQFQSQSALEDGTQSAAFEGAATTARVAGYASLTKGAMNVYQGMQMGDLQKKHEEASASLESAMLEDRREGFLAGGQSGKGWDRHTGSSEGNGGFIDGGNDVGKAIVKQYDLNKRMFRYKHGVTNEERANMTDEEYLSEMAKRKGEYDIKYGAMEEEVGSIKNSAVAEQEAYKKKAKKEKFNRYLAGAMGLLQSASQFITANQLDKTASKLKQAEKPPATINFEADPLAPNPGGDAGVNNPGINPPAASAPAISEFGDEEGGEGPPGLGTGFDLGGPEGDVDPNGIDIAGKTANQGGGPGGGNNANLGTGSTPQTASGESGQATQPVPAGTGRGVAYGGGNSRGGSYRGGRGGRGGDGDSNPDFSGLLSMFQQQQAQGGPQRQGIMEFDKKGKRGIASTSSLLGRDVNLFNRISKAYKFKKRQGEL